MSSSTPYKSSMSANDPTAAVKARIDDARDYASDVASDVARSSREAGAQVQEVAGNFKGALDKSLTDQPMATLGVAALVGFVIGAIWKS